LSAMPETATLAAEAVVPSYVLVAVTAARLKLLVVMVPLADWLVTV